MYQYPTGCWLGRGFPTNIQLVGGWVEGVLNQYSTGWVGGWRRYPISIQLVAGGCGDTLPVSNRLWLGAGGVHYQYPTGC